MISTLNVFFFWPGEKSGKTAEIEERVGTLCILLMTNEEFLSNECLVG